MENALKRHILATICAVVTLALTTSCSDDSKSKGNITTERQAVDAYVSALNSRDAAALKALAPPGNEATKEVDALIASKGGRELTITKLDISHEFGPDFAFAEVKTKDRSGKAFQDSLTLNRTSGEWYVALGENPKGKVGKTPAATNAP